MEAVNRNKEISRNFNSKKITVKIDEKHKKILTVQILDNKSGNKYGQNYTYETMGNEIKNLFPSIQEFYNKFYDQIEGEAKELTVEDNGFVKFYYIDRDKGSEPVRHVLILRTKLQKWKQTTNVEQTIQLIFSHLAKLQTQYQSKQQINLQITKIIEQNLAKIQKLNQSRQKINLEKIKSIQQNVAKLQTQSQSRQNSTVQMIKEIEENLAKLKMKIQSIQKIAQKRTQSIGQNLAKLQIRNQSTQKINQQKMMTIEQNLTNLQTQYQQSQKINQQKMMTIEQNLTNLQTQYQQSQKTNQQKMMTIEQNLTNLQTQYQQSQKTNQQKMMTIEQNLTNLQSQNQTKLKMNQQRTKSIAQRIQKIENIKADVLQNIIKNQKRVGDTQTLLNKMKIQGQQIISKLQYIQNDLQNKIRDQQTRKDLPTERINHTIQSSVSTYKMKEQQPEFNDMNLQIISEGRGKLIKITPDINTYAWKQNLYRKDNANQNVCIYQGDGDLQQLRSAQDLDCDGKCVFTIKVHKVTTWKDTNGIQRSPIKVGVMESEWKGENREDTCNHCVCLSLWDQKICIPNEEQTDREWIKCSCQSLASLPCLIECRVNRNQNTIIWHCNGKDQVKSSMPDSWKDLRKLCAFAMIWNKDDCLEFM